MASKRRWDPAISHRGPEVDAFVGQYFGTAERRVVFICGAGFDPRASAVATVLANVCPSLRGILIHEDRDNAPQAQLDRAANNTNALLAAIADREVVPVKIFGVDGAVVGGRNVVGVLSRQNFDEITDVVVDVSALSVGISFPIIRYLVERIERLRTPRNLHVFIAHDPPLDADIRPISSDTPGYIHGFKGGSTLDGSAAAAKLWLPQLAAGLSGALSRLYEFVAPHDTCPILPFPARKPRLGDDLAEEYLTELENSWSVDTRGIVYADEDDPLDLYRTILRLADLRKPVFAETGGSLLVLSPLGSKSMALGSLMAALERDLPVAHLEALGYELGTAVPAEIAICNLVHIWLEGEVYPLPRPALLKDATGAT